MGIRGHDESVYEETSRPNQARVRDSHTITDTKDLHRMGLSKQPRRVLVVERTKYRHNYTCFASIPIKVVGVWCECTYVCLYGQKGDIPFELRARTRLDKCHAKLEALAQC